MEWDGVNKIGLQENSCLFESGISNNMFSVDLKLGMLEHIRDVPMDTLKSSMALAMPSSSSSSLALSKRGRPRNSGQQNMVSCMVDGCTSDLSQCREYHRRHRVCERHSKTPVVLIEGKEMRFCQQCSRFHALGEFDDLKRSCRKRLDGHNRRRRKTQPENLYLINSGGFQSPSTAHTRNALLQFCGTANRPVISVPEKTLYNSGDQNLNSFLWSTNSADVDKPLPFIPNMNQQTSYQPFSDALESAGNRNDSRKVSPDKVTELANSECALSLLSRYPTQSSGISVAAGRQPVTMSSSAEVSNSALHLNYSLAQFSCSQGINDESSASIPSITNNSHILGGFQSGQDSLSENGPHIFPFSWQ